MKKVLQRLTVNAGGKGKVRTERFEGREYLAAPAAILARGVLEGSGGKIFYDDPDIRDSVPAWNYRPIVVGHPEDPDGNKISACSKEVLEAQQVGFTLNSAHDQKLRTECWFDVIKSNQVDKRIVTNLKAEKGLECSTGLFVNVEESIGEYEGTEYDGIARKYAPDHLAVILNGLGAYSIADGGGILTTNAAAGEPESLRLVYENSLKRFLTVAGLSCKTLKVNELSFSDITRQLCDLMKTAYGKPGEYWGGSVYETYGGQTGGRVVFMDESGKMFAQSYLVKDDVVALDGDPQEVVRSVQYKTVGNGVRYAVNSAGLLVPEEVVMAFDKKAHVAALVAAGVGTQEALDKFTDDQLQLLTVPKAPEPPVGNKKKDKTDDDPPPVVKADKKPTKTDDEVTFEKLLANAPAKYRNRFAEFEEAEAKEQAELVAAIVANENNDFTEEHLKTRPIKELRALAKLAGRKDEESTSGGTDYTFAAGYRPPVTNRSKKMEEPAPLEQPSDFD